ncbi:MAG TPA: DUF2092 domain-containing protein [Chthonomonadaceae bacterium]|nr:DUF2092 domain-containing protein [Chthonomonadaceae bacterium]
MSRGPSLLAAGLALAIVSGALPAAAQATTAHAAAPAYDPRALQELDRMVAAYSHLPTLEQTTEFRSALLPLTPDPAAASTESKPGSEKPKPQRILRLQFASPNRLRLEAEENDPKTNRPAISEWVSDGKEFWTYSAESLTYTHEKAPRHIHDFQKLAGLNTGTPEMMMLIGLNPFANLRSEVDSAACEGTTLVAGVPTDVVVLKQATAQERTEARFYIGQEDSLLRRCVIETVPIIAAPPVSNKVGDALDDLEAQTAPVTPPTSDPLPMKSRITYDNTINLHPAFDIFTFAFKIPEGASLFTPLDPRRGLVYPTENTSLIQKLKANAKKHKQHVFHG